MSAEQTTLNEGHLSFFEGEFVATLGTLEDAARESSLPGEPGARPAMEDYLIRMRLAYQAVNESSAE